jgi:hypothetical protein
MKKLAVLRSNESQSCPFGLDITYACHNAGEFIRKMVPLALVESEEEKQALSESNTKLLIWNDNNGSCSFSGQIIEPDTVNCNFSDDDLGKTQALLGSSYYWKNFSGTSIDGGAAIEGAPLSFFQDYSIDRGMFYGPYSIESIAKKEG